MVTCMPDGESGPFLVLPDHNVRAEVCGYAPERDALMDLTVREMRDAATMVVTKLVHAQLPARSNVIYGGVRLWFLRGTHEQMINVVRSALGEDSGATFDIETPEWSSRSVNTYILGAVRVWQTSTPADHDACVFPTVMDVAVRAAICAYELEDDCVLEIVPALWQRLAEGVSLMNWDHSPVLRTVVMDDTCFFVMFGIHREVLVRIRRMLDAIGDVDVAFTAPQTDPSSFNVYVLGAERLRRLRPSSDGDGAPPAAP